MNKKTLIALISFATILVTSLVFYFFYQNNTNIYEPVSISFKDFEVSDTNLIQILSISPIGRQSSIKYNIENNNWETTDGSYSKSINLVLKNSITEKYKSINIKFNYQTTVIFINELKVINETENEKQYDLPPSIRSEKSFLNKAKFILASNDSIILVTIPYLFALLILISFVLLIFFIIKYKKGSAQKEVIYKWVRTICFSVIIAFALFYGYLLIKFTLSSYITSALFVIVSGIMLWYFSMFIIKMNPPLQRHSKKIKIILLTFIVIWFCTESSLRYFGVNKGYNETLTSFYSSGFNKDLHNDSQNPHLFTYEKRRSYIDKKKEFAYKIQSNTDGLRDNDHSIEKQKDEVRIICIGNSFTEGIGTPQDSTWPKLLEDKLEKVCTKKTTVFNAGISGSDPFFGHMLLKEKMLKYKPDLVLLTLQVTDFNFYRFRGGFERFTENGYHYRKAPSWERLYAVSYVFRFILNDIFDYEAKYLQSRSDYQADSLKANADIENCVRSFYQLSKEEDFNLVVVFLDNIGSSRYDFLIEKLKIEGIIPVIDLKYYNRNIEKLSDKDLESYYWKIDRHFNSRGYDLTSKGIMWNFNNMGILDSLNNSTEPVKSDFITPSF